jgi:hypothetical protein
VDHDKRLRHSGMFRKIGYVEARREVAWETFFNLDETEMAKLSAS